jgi:glucose-6-phosphate 1-dehydrogenase
MVQNHILQVLLIWPWTSLRLSSADVLPEKIKVLENLCIPDEATIAKNFIRGQYQTGCINQQDYPSYVDEPSVDPTSKTETFASGVFFIETDRFKGVPFFFRTGKRLTEKGTRINILFKNEQNISIKILSKIS